MTIAQMGERFDLIQDKSDSPYFTDAEKTVFLNDAQLTLINEYVNQFYFPSQRGGRGSARSESAVEATAIGSQLLQPLIVSDLSVVSSATGVILNTQIDAALQAVTGDAKGHMFIIAVAEDLATSTRKVRWVRHNDFQATINNQFKNQDGPIYRLSRGSLTVNQLAANNYLVSVIKEPLDVVLDTVTPANNVNSELPSFIHNDIVAIALNDAGVASRDEALMAFSQLADQNLTSLS